MMVTVVLVSPLLMNEDFRVWYPSGVVINRSIVPLIKLSPKE